MLSGVKFSGKAQPGGLAGSKSVYAFSPACVGFATGHAVEKHFIHEQLSRRCAHSGRTLHHFSWKDVSTAFTEV